MITAALDHLWQSTLFAGLAGLVTLSLRGNAARVRFWVWFAASAKFLMPFSALVALGAALLPAAPVARFEEFAPAFAPVAEPLVIPVAHARALAHAAAGAVPQGTGFDWTPLLFLVWGAGSFAVVCWWLSRWLKLRAAMRQASALPPWQGLKVRSASRPLEPGLFGVWRPVILLPQGIEKKLSPPELEAVLAHEPCHLRQRDNLWAAIHMLVEALFWFHPLVWWLGARLNHERERACDEAVLAAGQEPQVYAESILKVCRLYVHSSLPCVSGVSGSNLKERIERIVVGSVALPLGWLRKLILAALAAGALVVPLSIGLLLAPAMVQAQTPAEAPLTPERIAELRADQAAPRSVVPFDPKSFDKFVGEYQLAPTAIFWITRDGSHYLSRLTGQVAVEIFPEGPTKFFATVVPAQISFDSDAGGHVTGLVLHQAGMEQHAPRITAEAAKAAEDALLARIKANKPASGTEAAIRHQIDSMQRTGEFDYAAMTPQLAAVARSQAAIGGPLFARLGAFQSLAFKNVGPGGGDVYEVTFERGHMIWSMAPLTADGKIRGMGERPVQP